MKDKLPKRNKVDWLGIIHALGHDEAFFKFCKGKKVRSRRRLAYMFIKHINGRRFCKMLCSVTDLCKQHFAADQLEEIIRIAKTPWLSED